MEATSSKSDRVKEVGRGKKKRRSGMKFSGSKALRRSAMRKRDATGSCDDDHLVDEVDTNVEEFLPGRYKAVKMRLLNLDAVVESVEGEEDEDGGDWNDVNKEQEDRRRSSSRSEYMGSEQDSEDEGIEKVVSSKTWNLQNGVLIQSFSLTCLDVFVQFDKFETLLVDIFGQQETQRDIASEGATIDEEGEHREMVDGGQQEEQEESEEVGVGVLNQNPAQEIDWSVRPEFMIYRHSNGYIQHWLIENPAIPWGDPGEVNDLEAGNEQNTVNALNLK